MNSTSLKGFKKFISLFTLVTSLQINKKSVAKGDFEFNPFKYGLNNSDLITLNTAVLNTVSFNRFSPKWGIDVSNINNNGKALLTYGYESRKLKDWPIKFRWNLSRSISLNINYRKGTNALYTPNAQFDNRNYELKINSLEPFFTFIRGTSFRVTTSYKMENKKNNPLYGGETAISNSINVESKYNVLQNSSIMGKFTFNNIDFKSRTGATTTVSYIMLDGLLPGKNYLWSLSLTKRLINNLEINFQYDGRKPAGAKTINTGRVTATALF